MNYYNCLNYIVIKENVSKYLIDDEEYGDISPGFSYLYSYISDVSSFSSKEVREFLNNNTFAVRDNSTTFSSIDWVYIYNSWMDELEWDYDDSDGLIKVLNFCNSVRLKKENFINIIKQWNDQVLKDNPEFVLLWQDEQDVVYLETFESEDLVKKRINKVKRVVGEKEVED